MKNVLNTIALTTIVITSTACSSEPKAPELETTPTNFISVEYYKESACSDYDLNHITKDGSEFEYQIVQADGQIDTSATTKYVVNNSYPGKSEYSEYIIIEGSPPITGDTAQHRFGFLPTQRGVMSLSYGEFSPSLEGLKPNETTKANITERIQDRTREAAVEITFKGCGVMNNITPAVNGQEVRIYRMKMPTSKDPAAATFDSAIELEFIVSNELNWPIVYRNSGSDIILTSLK